MTLKAPFPWFGGKSRVAPLVWERFGAVPNYVEPFFGSGAVLLERASPAEVETINDRDCFVANFWRALQADPDAVAAHADNPVNEADQHARHVWLRTNGEFQELMKTDPHFYDAKVAGWWVWGQCVWIGSGWCWNPRNQVPHLGASRGVHRKLPHLGDAGKGVHRQMPELGNSGRGIHRQLPHLGDPGQGVHRQLPHLGTAGHGINRALELEVNLAADETETDLTAGVERGALKGYMRALAERLRQVRVCCGDWSRVCGDSVTFRHGVTGFFLDPPYVSEGRDEVYAEDDSGAAEAARMWALDNGDNPLMRIALCGYEGTVEMPDSWECVAWKAPGGYGTQGDDRGRANANRERIWFSRYCLGRAQASLFAGG